MFTHSSHTATKVNALPVAVNGVVRVRVHSAWRWYPMLIRSIILYVLFRTYDHVGEVVETVRHNRMCALAKYI